MVEKSYNLANVSQAEIISKLFNVTPIDTMTNGRCHTIHWEPLGVEYLVFVSFCSLKTESSMFTFTKYFLLYRCLCAQKIYKLRQTRMFQFVYFSLVLREQEETKTKYSAP